MPELDNGCRSGYLSAERERVRVPVIPAHSKAHSVVDVTRTELWNGPRKRQPSRHLPQGHHQGENCHTGDDVAQQNGQRAGLRKSTSNTQEETGADSAA